VRILDVDPSQITVLGDNGMDLSMQIPGSNFIGFNPNGQDSHDTFNAAGVPVVASKDLRDIWPHLFDGEYFPGESA
jgi:hypothetical protein